MMVCALWTPVVMLALITAAAWGWGVSPDRVALAHRHGWLAVAAAVLVRVLQEPLSRWWDRPRPFEAGYAPLLAHGRGGSFPSNHAAGAFALASAFAGVPGYGPVLWVLAGWLALARVYCGLHHPVDVVAGALHGALMGSWLAR